MLVVPGEQGGRGDDAQQHNDVDDRKRKRDANVGETKEDEKKQHTTFTDTAKKLELAKMSNPSKLGKIIEGQEPVTKSLIPEHIESGVLIPLKTTLELRDDHQCGQVLITRSPIRSTSAVIGYVREPAPSCVCSYGFGMALRTDVASL